MLLLFGREVAFLGLRWPPRANRLGWCCGRGLGLYRQAISPLFGTLLGLELGACQLLTRFLDMSKAYDRGLRQLALEVAAAEGIPMHQGVYVGLAGPTFETPAEIRFLRLMGGDTVGMSTTSETVTAHHGGMRVLGISGVSNVAIDQVDSQSEASHEEVLEAGALLTPRMTAVIRGVLRQL